MVTHHTNAPAHCFLPTTTNEEDTHPVYCMHQYHRSSALMVVLTWQDARCALLRFRFCENAGDAGSSWSSGYCSSSRQRRRRRLSSFNAAIISWMMILMVLQMQISTGCCWSSSSMLRLKGRHHHGLRPAVRTATMASFAQQAAGRRRRRRRMLLIMMQLESAGALVLDDAQDTTKRQRNKPNDGPPSDDADPTTSEDVVVVAGVSSCTATTTETSSSPQSAWSAAVPSPQPPAKPKRVGLMLSWMQRARQLYEYQQRHGHCHVPKRYPENPALSHWVSRQRQEYRRRRRRRGCCEEDDHDHHNDAGAALTESRIAILNQMNFCWDGTACNISSDQCIDSLEQQQQQQQQQWWTRLQEIREYLLEDKERRVCSGGGGSDEREAATAAKLAYRLPRQTRMGVWLDRQRALYRDANANVSSSRSRSSATTRQPPPAAAAAGRLSTEQIAALAELDPDWWMTRRQWQWERRFRELQDYAARHNGDCCVPISYPSNRPLANWVSTQRKQFNKRMVGKPSDLDDYRLQRLEEIGFVWSARSWQ